MAVDPKALGLGLATNKAVELIAAQFDAVDTAIGDAETAAVQKIEGASAFSVTGVTTPLFTVANTADTAGIVDYLAAITAALQDAGVI